MLNLKNTPIKLSQNDIEKITTAIENPPAPNESLKAAYKRHQEEMSKFASDNNMVQVNIIDILDQECSEIAGDTYENFINKTNSIPERRAAILIAGLLSDDPKIIEKAKRIYGNI